MPIILVAAVVACQLNISGFKYTSVPVNMRRPSRAAKLPKQIFGGTYADSRKRVLSVVYEEARAGLPAVLTFRTISARFST